MKQFGQIIEYRRLHPGLYEFTFVRSRQIDNLKTRRQIRSLQFGIRFQWSFDDIQRVQYANIADELLASPAPTSPDNILNVLNDDCLLEIFRILDPLDMCSTGLVCHRFRDISLRIVATTHRKISAYPEHPAPIWKWEQYFRMYGTSIQAFETNHPGVNVLIGFMEQYCKNVVEFDGTLERYTQAIGPVFRQLQTLRLFSGVPLDGILEADSQLKSIGFFSCHEILPVIHLPNLVDVSHGPSWCDPLFFMMNPQIEKLGLVYGEHAPIIDRTLEHLPNLQELHIRFKPFIADSQRIVCEDFSVFGGLCHLHTLRTTLLECDDIKQILQALLHNDIELKRLILLKEGIVFPVMFHEGNHHPIFTICQMQSIEYLRIDWINDDELIQVAEKCINLTEIQVDCSGITPAGMSDALARMPNIEKATFEISCVKWSVNEQAANELAINDIDILRRKRRINMSVRLMAESTQILPEVKTFFHRYSSWITIVE